MKTKFTPGPWKLGEIEIVNDPVTGAAIAARRIETTLGNILVIDETNEPGFNRELIASSPDLYAALQALLERSKAIDTSTTHDGLSNCKAIAQARAALKKARGEE